MAIGKGDELAIGAERRALEQHRGLRQRDACRVGFRPLIEIGVRFLRQVLSRCLVQVGQCFDQRVWPLLRIVFPTHEQGEEKIFHLARPLVSPLLF